MGSLREGLLRQLKERGESEKDVICVWVREFNEEDYSEERNIRLSWDEAKDFYWVNNGIHVYTKKTIYFLVEYDSTYHWDMIPRDSREPRDVRWF